MTPKSAARSRGCGRPAGSWPRSSRCVEAIRARRHHARARPARRAPHPVAPGAIPRSSGYLGRRYDARDPHATRRRRASRIDDEVVHGIPGNRRSRGGQIVSIDVGRDRRRLARRRRPHLHRGARCRHADPSRWSRPPGSALMAGIAAAQPGRRPGRHLGGGRGRRARGRLRHRPPVRGPRHRHRDARGAPGHQLPHRQPRAASSSPGSASPSSRCSRSAATRSRVRSRTAGPWRRATASLAAHLEHTIAVTDGRPEILTCVVPLRTLPQSGGRLTTPGHACRRRALLISLLVRVGSARPRAGTHR